MSALTEKSSRRFLNPLRHKSWNRFIVRRSWVQTENQFYWIYLCFESNFLIFLLIGEKGNHFKDPRFNRWTLVSDAHNFGLRPASVPGGEPPPPPVVMETYRPKKIGLRAGARTNMCAPTLSVSIANQILYLCPSKGGFAMGVNEFTCALRPSTYWQQLHYQDQGSSFQLQQEFQREDS